MQRDLRIVFMGTPDFAVPGLQALVEAGCHVVGVVTAPDRPSGRGLKLVSSPVKTYAERMGIRVLQPERLKDKGFLEELRGLQADLQVVIAFRMLPEVVWGMPALGTFNLHASLLPDYRGAAPINWTLINGEKETGVTTFFIEKEIDTGKIIFQEKEPVYEDDNAGTLYTRLMHKGASLVLKTVRAIESGVFPAIAQEVKGSPKEAPKIFRETCRIDWDRPFAEVYNFVRGLAPYPAAWTGIGHLTAKIYRVKATAVPEAGDGARPGDYRSDGRKYLAFRCADGWAAVEEIQLEGRRKMTIEELLRGWRPE